MSWTCPNQMKDRSCKLRKKECKPCSEGCIVSNKFKLIGDEPARQDEPSKKDAG